MNQSIKSHMALDTSYISLRYKQAVACMDAHMAYAKANPLINEFFRKKEKKNSDFIFFATTISLSAIEVNTMVLVRNL